MKPASCLKAGRSRPSAPGACSSKKPTSSSAAANCYLIGCHISPLPTASTHINPDPVRTRKLLLHAEEINKLIGKVERAGFTLVPLDMHFVQGRIKLEIGLAKGKNSTTSAKPRKSANGSAKNSACCGTNNESFRIRRLLRQRQNHLDRAADPAVRGARAESILDQAYPPRFLHRPAGQGFLPSSHCGLQRGDGDFTISLGFGL